MDSIIFDVDGTLWDSTQICADAWNDAVRQNSDLESNITADTLKGLFGKPMDVIFDALFGKQDEKLKEMLIEKCCEYEDRYLKEREDLVSIAYDGVIDTLKKLSDKYKLFIVSNCQLGYIEILIDKLKIEEVIVDHLCFGETKTSKGQTMLKLIERNQLESPVYVGDTQGDLDACKEAGVPFVFAAYGFGNPSEYAVKINRFEDLLDNIALANPYALA